MSINVKTPDIQEMEFTIDNYSERVQEAYFGSDHKTYPNTVNG